MTRRTGGRPEARVSVTFTARARAILLEETLADPEYSDRLVEKKGRWVAGFTASELDDILGYLASAANHTPRVKLRKELDALYDRLETLCEGENAHAGDAS
jgi:hypothetical protein